MPETHRVGKLAVILHADIAGSTALVQQDEHLAHERFQDAFQRFAGFTAQHHGHVRELRGDALLAEFERASDAVTAALAFQADQAEHNTRLDDAIRPSVRVGIAIGEVVLADNTVTGAGVVLAQRVEQLARPGGVCVTAAIHEALPRRMPFEQDNLGEQALKGFDEPVRVYAVRLRDGAELPEPDGTPTRAKPSRTRLLIATVIGILLVGGGILSWLQPWAPDLEPASIDKMAFTLPDKPSIAVLPFDNLSGDPTQDYLVDGITETVITELSRFRSLFVVARNSVFTYKDRPVRVQQVAEDLGVQYVLEGSVQRSANRLRITAQLIDATGGNHLWAQSYDREMLDVFVIQDDVTQRVVASLGAHQGELAEATRERAKRKHPDSVSAYEAYQLGIEHKHRFTKEDNAAAQTLFIKAIELSPQFAQAYVGMAWVHIQQFWFGWADDPEQAVARTYEAARRAVDLDPSDAEAHWLLAEAYFADNQFEQTEAEFQKALALNPNDADLLAGWGYASVLLGEPERAVEFITDAMRLNPHYPDWYDRALGTAAYMAKRYEEAIAAFKKVSQHVIQSRLYLAASYAQLNRVQQARAEVAAAIELDADISIEKFSRIETYKDPADLEHLRDGLRKAGLPEIPPLALPGKPSIAVMPFDNMSNDPEQEYFSDGLTEDLITDLSRISAFLVIARNSSFAYKDRSTNAQQVGRELGARYLLEGSVRKAGDQVRINAQLIDTTTGTHLWAQRYDRNLTDIFALQDEVTNTIVKALAVSLTQDEQAKLGAVRTVNPDAYDTLLRGNERLQLYTPEDMLAARALYEQAIALDPGYARAHANLAYTYAVSVLFGWAKDEAESIRIGMQAAERSLALDDRIPQIHFTLANLYSAQGRPESARLSARRTIELDPNYADGFGVLAVMLTFTGDLEEALTAIHNAMRLNPHYSYMYLWVKGRILFHLERYEEAATILEQSVERNPSFDRARMILAATYAHLDRIDDAQWQADELMALRPDFTVSAMENQNKYKHETDEARLIDALRKAGLPE